MNNDRLYNQQEILARVAEGDQRAFVLLIDQHTAVVYAHVLTYLKNVSKAEEITQDIFLRLWKHREQLPSINNFLGYLHVITRNATISAFREKIIRWEETEKDVLEANSLNPADAMEFRQLSDTILKAVDLLPPRRKVVFKMSRFENNSYEEIAAKLNISKSAVNQHIVEALLFLRTYLSSHSFRFCIIWFIYFFLLA